MGQAINVKVELGEREFPTKDAVATAVKVKAEGVLANWFHRLEHAVRGTMAKGALAGLAHLTHAYTAYTITKFLVQWFDQDYKTRDALLRAQVGFGATPVPDLLTQLLPGNGVVFGWGEYSGDQIARVWLAGAFVTGTNGNIVDGRDRLSIDSRFRARRLDDSVVPFSAELNRAWL